MIGLRGEIVFIDDSDDPAGTWMVGDPGIGGSPIQGDRVYRAAMLGEQGVPKKYGSNRQKFEVDAIRACSSCLRVPAWSGATGAAAWWLFDEPGKTDQSELSGT